MGIIRVLKDAVDAVTGTVEGGLADQFLEVIEPDDMGATTIFTSGVPVRHGNRRGGNHEGTQGVITDGSIIHVYDNQFMLLVDGGKVVDYTAEPGYFQVSNTSAPSLFHGQLDESLQEAFQRLKFGGTPSSRQQVFFINMQEIKGLKFGTRNAINYFDSFYNAELFLRAHGTYSIKVVDPFTFYQEVIPRNARRVDISEVDEQWLNEFLEALQSAINEMSINGVRVSHVTSKSRELGQYMSVTLDDSWRKLRGIEIRSVGIASLGYDKESQALINMRNQGAMLADATVREGYMQGATARGLEAAGSNTAGAMTGFAGIGVGLQGSGKAASTFSETNRIQMNESAAAASPSSANLTGWTCGCGTGNLPNAKFCGNCGTPRAEPTCRSCGYRPPPGTPAKFCPECGQPIA